MKPKYPQRQIYVTDEESVPEDAYDIDEDMSAALETDLVNTYYVELLKDGDRPPVFEGKNQQMWWNAFLCTPHSLKELVM